VLGQLPIRSRSRSVAGQGRRSHGGSVANALVLLVFLTSGGTAACDLGAAADRGPAPASAALAVVIAEMPTPVSIYPGTQDLDWFPPLTAEALRPLQSEPDTAQG